MSDNVVIRAHGLGGGREPVAPLRRAVTLEHVAFVEANRRRMSWQAMASCCRVNQTDLRRRCDQAFAASEAAIKPPASCAAAGEVNRRGADPLKVLRAILNGACSRQDIAEILGISPRSANDAVADLKRCGWLAGHGRSFAGWQVTAAGFQALKTPARHG